MKIMSILAFLAWIPSLLHAQTAVINDKDGYSNIREKPSNDSKVVGRMYSDDIFYYSEDKANKDWVEVGLDKGNNYLTGYLHRSRLKPLTEMKEILANHQLRNGFLSIKNDTLLFEIKSYEFDPKKHQVEQNSQSVVTKIDGAYPHGVFGNIPKTGIKSVVLTIRSKSIPFPTKEYSDLFEPGLDRMHLYVNDDGTLYIDSGNSDGAGGYELIWVIRNKKYIKREILVP